MRRYRDRDYVQTMERYFFCVVGAVHPEDRVIAYLKYIPDPAGNWGKKNNRFKRLLRYYTVADLLETLNFLDSHPEYLYDSSVMGIKMSAVPLDRIIFHLKPEEKMSQLMQMRKPDVLQRKVVDLANLISDESGVSIEYFGVTGSVLLDIHREFSDIDLIVYGVKNSQLVKQALIKTYKEQESPIRRFDAEMTKRWCLEKTRSFPLSYEEAFTIFERKWGRGLFAGTTFSMHPVKLEAEVSEKYGDCVFKQEGIVKAEATICDASEAEFLPSIYRVEDVKIVDGGNIENIREVASYEGLYGGIAEEGEKILVYGKLERVIDGRVGKEYYRILVGSKEAVGKDYVKLICLS